jgi:membrane protein
MCWKLVQDQIVTIAKDKSGGLLTLGMIGTIWSTSSGVTAIIDTLNQAYDIQESRPWWKVRLLALGLTVALALFIVVSFALVLVGPTLAERVAVWAHMGPVFTWTWKILQWPVIFALIAFAIAVVYYYAPDAKQEWIWITPGSIFATVLWILISLGFRFYVAHFGSYNATYGAIGGVIVTMLWFYVVAGDTGRRRTQCRNRTRVAGQGSGRKGTGREGEARCIAERASREGKAAGTPGRRSRRRTAMSTPTSCRHAPEARPRVSDWVVTGVVFGEAALLVYAKLRSRLTRIRS